MLRSLTVAAVAAFFGSCGQAPTTARAQPAPSATGPAGAAAKPPAPAFKPGMVVSDRGGALVGVVKTVAETTAGLNVVIEIDGKLVGVSPSTLQLRGNAVVSRQTKAEILATAGAPADGSQNPGPP